MAGEGDLNKINGDIWFAGDVTSVLNAIGLNFKNQTNLLWNASLNGYNSDLMEDFKNLQQDDLDDTSQIDETNGDIKDVPIFPAAVMDNHDDSSIDANIWTTASAGGGLISEGTQFISLTGSGSTGGSASAVADQINSVDLNSDGIVFFIKLGTFSSNYPDGADTAKISIVDQSANEVVIATVTDSNINNNIYRLNINTASNTMGIHVNNITGTTDTGTDISSLVDGDVWNFKIDISFTSSGGSAAISANVAFERYIDGSAETDDFISDATTSSSTITNAILSVSEDTGAGTISYFLSADNGANYEAVTQDTIHRFTNTGTQLKMKATMVSTTSDMPILWHHATQFNFY